MRFDRFRPVAEHLSSVTDIQGEVNRIFDSFFGRPATVQSGERTWAPVADVFETKDDVIVAFELPGVRENDVSVSMTGDVLTVRGERKFERQVDAQGFHKLERAYGRFERSVQLPMPVQQNQAKAVFRDGVLEITLPKVEEVKPREIKIEIA